MQLFVGESADRFDNILAQLEVFEAVGKVYMYNSWLVIYVKFAKQKAMKFIRRQIKSL